MICCSDMHRFSVLTVQHKRKLASRPLCMSYLTEMNGRIFHLPCKTNWNVFSTTSRFYSFFNLSFCSNWDNCLSVNNLYHHFVSWMFFFSVWFLVETIHSEWPMSPDNDAQLAWHNRKVYVKRKLRFWMNLCSKRLFESTSQTRQTKYVHYLQTHKDRIQE